MHFTDIGRIAPAKGAADVNNMKQLTPSQLAIEKFKNEILQKLDNNNLNVEKFVKKLEKKLEEFNTKYKINKSEKYLTKLTKSTKQKGCTETNLIKGANEFGLKGYFKKNSSIKELRKL